MERSIEEILKNVRIHELELTRLPPVSPSTPVGEAYRLLDEKHRSAVVVCEGENVVGIFTQRDVLYRTAVEDIDPSTQIRELMTPDPRTLRPEQRLADAIRAMIEGGYRQCPLVDQEGREAGLLTSRDVLRFIADHFPDAVVNLPPRLHQQLKRPEGG